MTPETIIEQVAADGVHLALSRDGKIKATGEQGAVNRWVQTIKANKPGIVAALQGSADVTIEPASPTARPIYWKAMDGTWHGPVKPECLGRTGTGDKELFWVIVTYQKTVRWIRSDLLRSRQAFEAQRKGAR